MLEHFGIEDVPPPDLADWERLMRRASEAADNDPVRIALVGKYVKLEDAYLSVAEALRHAGFQHGCPIEIDWVDSETLADEEVRDRVAQADGILIPGGFGVRGIEGKITASRIAREQKIPFLGICLGMQMAVADFARHVVDMEGANSTEFDPETPYPVIDLLPEQKEVADMGGTMRLGADPVKLHENTKARELYGEAVIYERHRHRYEVNNFLRKRLEAAGLVISGTSPDDRLVEIIEIHDHPFFVASQYHPEFKSRPERPAPLFREFVAAALGRARERRPQEITAHQAAHTHVRRASEAEKARLAELFTALCRIPSPFGHERECADRVIAELRGMGLEPEEDETGNVLARLDGRGDRSVLLCAHLDTVETEAPIEPVLVDGGWENAHDGILGADNKAAVAVMLEVARRASDRGLAGRPRAAVHRLRGGRAGRRQGVRRRPPALRVRLRVRPRDPDRRGRRRLADLLPPRGRLPRQGRARRHPPRGRPQRGAGRRAGDRRDAARPHRRPDDRQRRLGPRRHRLDERRARALPRARRGALARRRAGRGRRGEDGRRPARRRRPGGVRRRRRVREALHRLQGAPAAPPSSPPPRRRCARAATSRGGSRPAEGRTPTPSRPPASPASTSPTAPSATTSRPSASRSPRSRGCSTSRSSCWRRRHELAVRAHRQRDDLRGQVLHGAARPFRHEDGEEVEREIVPHTGAVGIVVLDGENLWFVRQPREAIGRPGPARAAGRQARRGGRVAARHRQARAGRGDRQAGREWEPLGLLLHVAGFTDEEVHLFLATGISDVDERPEVEHDERIDAEVRPLADLDAILAETKDSKTLIGLYALRDRLTRRTG